MGSSFTPTPDSYPYKDPSLHTVMEGWTGIAPFHDTPYFRRTNLADIDCSPDAALGNFSFFAGVLAAEAIDLCYVSGGYGNSWNVCIEKRFTYSGVGTVSLSYDYALETEPDFDYVYVYSDTSVAGDGSALVSLLTDTGSHVGDYDLTLGSWALPSTARDFAIRFCVESDGAYSDEDGLYSTICGAFLVDNIEVSGTGFSDFTDFETSDDGWNLTPPLPTPGGDWSNIAHLDDLSPALSDTCPLSDSVLVFVDDTGTHGQFQDNLAVSPWIDLKAAGHVGELGKVLLMDVYENLSMEEWVLIQIQAQWYPYTCQTTGNIMVSPLTSTGFVYINGPWSPSVEGCGEWAFDISETIPRDAEQVRVAVGVITYCRFFSDCSETSNQSPWFDNIRFGTFSAPDLAITSSPLTASPDTLCPGEEVQLSSWTLENLGSEDVGAFTSAYYFNPNRGQSGDRIFLGSENHAGLSAGGVEVIPGPLLSIPPDIPAGLHRIYVRADTGHVTGDVITSNNVIGTDVRVKGPVCALDPDPLNFGSVRLTNSMDLSFTLRNEGTDCGSLAGTVDSVCAPFEILSGSGPYDLGTGDSVVVSVRYSPITVGTDSCWLATGSDCSPILISGNAIPAGEVFPTTLDLGNAFVGNDTDSTFVVRNLGSDSLDVDINETCPNFSIVGGAGPASIPAGDSLVVTVRFSPVNLGTDSCFVDTGCIGCPQVICVGNAIPQPGSATISPAFIDFGSLQPGQEQDSSFVVKNVGGDTLDVDITETCPNFSIVGGAGPASIPAGDSLVVTVRFSPLSSGADTCIVQTGCLDCLPVECVGVGLTVTRLLVDADAADTVGVGTGFTWTHAYPELRDALSFAGSHPEIEEIWVAEGTYAPDTLDSAVSFQLLNGLTILGGFAGTETSASQRDPVANLTILSGEIGTPGPSDNSYHVLNGSGVDSTAVLSGFTIRDGNASGDPPDNNGGGMHNVSGSPTLTHLTFENNTADNKGGGMYNEPDSSPQLAHVTFVNNTSSDGGGLFAKDNSNIEIIDSVFQGNTAGRGGGFYLEGGNSKIVEATFDGNVANSRGGGLYVRSSDPELTTILFHGNQATEGGALHNESSSPVLTNVTIGENAAENGGGIYNASGSDPVLVNVILWGNSASKGEPQMENGGTADPVISSSLIHGSGGSGPGWDSDLGTDGGNNLDGDPLFENMFGGNLRLLAGSPAIDTGDSTAANLGPMDLDGNPRIIGNTVDMGAYEYDSPTGLEDETPGPTPVVTALHRAFPNPFSDRVTIQYDLAASSPVQLDIFDAMGRHVNSLEDSPSKSAGQYRITWDGRDAEGRRVSAGIYLYRLSTNSARMANKILLVR